MSNFISIRNVTVLKEKLTLTGGVLKFSMTREIGGKAGVCRITLDDPFGEIIDTAEIGAPFSFGWMFNGGEENRLFTGTIVDFKVPAPHQIAITAFDDFNKLLTIPLTRTLEKQSPSEMIRTLIGGELGLSTDRVDEFSGELDKLPLYKMTGAQAIAAINFRLKLKHDFYVDEQGVFVWGERDLEQEPAYDFEYGVNLIDISMRESRFSTWATPILLRQVVRVIDQEKIERLLFVTGLCHRITKRGSRTDVFFEEINNG
jgi:hypothetical protein